MRSLSLIVELSLSRPVIILKMLVSLAMEVRTLVESDRGRDNRFKFFRAVIAQMESECSY